MSGPPTPADWDRLGISPGATLEEARRAYQRRRSIWDGETLATYGLADDGERDAMLAELEASWGRVSGSLARPMAGTTTQAAPATPAPVGDEPAPDPAISPGAHLRHHRERRGLTLAAVAAVTRIQAGTLDKLEREELTGLPARVFVRGFVVQYARALGLEGADELAASFVARLPEPTL